jgi:hypothetical protein
MKKDDDHLKKYIKENKVLLEKKMIKGDKNALI